MAARGVIESVSSSGAHTFSKAPMPSIRLLAGLGVAGDAHMGATVKHRSRVAQDPTQPNLRQVHLIHAELFETLRDLGFDVAPGELGENVTTRGVDLLGLPVGTVLRLGDEAAIEVTGLRNPCAQIDGFSPGLLKKLVYVDDAGAVVRLAGIMSTVLAGGDVRPGDPIAVQLPAPPHRALERV